MGWTLVWTKMLDWHDKTEAQCAWDQWERIEAARPPEYTRKVVRYCTPCAVSRS